jgi:hypothetical protein
VVGRHVVDDQMVAVRASSMGIVRVVRASLTVTAHAMIVARASLNVMTVVARASLTVMIGVRVAMMVTDLAVRGSSTVIDRAMIAVRASLIAMTAAVRGNLTVTTDARVATTEIARANLTATTAVVRASSTVTTGAHGVLIAAIVTSRSVRRPRRIVDAQRCFSAKVAVSTAKIIRVRLAVMTSGRSLTRAQCADRESVMFAATSGAQPTSALAINVPPIAVTVLIGETGDINFLHLVHSKSNWPKRSVAPWETDGLPM